jgi:hypothetical protein
MRVWLISLLVLTVTATAPAADKVEKPAHKAGVAHLVYFTLDDSSAAARDKLIAACEKYLSKHKGTLYFSAGVPAEPLEPAITDKDYHVALHLVFEDKAAHDAYQEHADHKKFIAENKGNWKKVRVFDFVDEAAAERNAAHKDQHVVHGVYFSLQDGSEAGRKAFIKALNDHLCSPAKPYYVRFSAGERGKGFDRDVNDKDYDVALFIVFENRKGLETYLPADYHKKFVEENRAKIKGVRVFDDAVKK